MLDVDSVLSAAREGWGRIGARNAALVGAAGDLTPRMPNSDWSAADAAAHLVLVNRVLGAIAGGAPSPIESMQKEALAALSARLIDEFDETDPGRLSALLTESLAPLLDTLGQRPADGLVDWHEHRKLPVWALACVGLLEHLLHGYDIATALGRPWPITVEDASLALAGAGPNLPLMVNPETTAGLTAAIEVVLRTGGGFVARFTDGRLAVEQPGDGPVDATLSADPVALLLVASGRLSRWPAVALGHLSATGDRPDLALGFFDLFVYP